MRPTTKYRIPLSAPCLIGREREYVNQAISANQLTAGEFVDRFEAAFAEYVGAKYAIATSSGTTALHLALLACGVEPDDVVACPTLTYIAAPNAIHYCGATPEFLDADPQTWQAAAPESTLYLAVHLYGVAAPVPTDNRIVIEDCAEALGTRVNGHHVGTFGVAGAFSFYGNKVITTGEGGMVVTNDRDVADRVRLLRGQGMDSARRYYHPVVGFNYRMTNLQAAVGLGQLEVIEEQLARRGRVWLRYSDHVQDLLTIPAALSHHMTRSPWLMAGVFDSVAIKDRVVAACEAAGIETRPLFYPCHLQPPYATETGGEDHPSAWDLYTRGIVLPLHAGMTLREVDEVCAVVRQAVVANVPITPRCPYCDNGLFSRMDDGIRVHDVPVGDVWTIVPCSTQ